MTPSFSLTPSAVSRIWLSVQSCIKHHVKLCIEKTKLQAIHTPGMSHEVQWMKITSPVNIDGKLLPFSETVEHVGILRNSFSNLPNIMNRVKVHDRAMGSVLHAGLARNHSGNPAASLKVEKIYV